jgi:hypothetical protein
MRKAEPLAGLGGLLLLVSLFLPWYQVDVVETAATEHSRTLHFTGWTIFDVTDVLLAALALLAVAVPIASLATRGPAKSIATAVLASALGWIAVVLVLFRMLVTPYDLELDYGIWVGLAGATLAWVGSWLSMRDESTPGAVAPDLPRRPAPAA